MSMPVKKSGSCMLFSYFHYMFITRYNPPFIICVNLFKKKIVMFRVKTNHIFNVAAYMDSSDGGKTPDEPTDKEKAEE